MNEGESRSEPEIGVEAWELVLRTHATLIPLLSEQLETATGLPLSWYDVLLELDRAPEDQLRMTDLGERVVLSRSHVSRVVDQLVQAGLVDKISDETDRRSTRAVLTAKGRQLFRKAAVVYLAAIGDHFSDQLTARQSRAIVDGLRSVLNNHE